jgi:CheY-like chemotaxis protein
VRTELNTKIYLAVPDPVLNRQVRQHLAELGHRVQEAMDWSLVPEEVGLFGAELVILAHELPDATALEVIDQLRTDPRTAARSVMVLLPEDKQDDVEGYFEAGADDALVLPLIPAVLINRVRLLSGRAGMDSGEMPELMVSIADEVIPLEYDEEKQETLPGVRVSRQIGEGITDGFEGYYEADMGTLIEVSEAMASSLPTTDSLYVLVRRISQTIPVHRCNVVIQGVKDDEAFVVASHDDPDLRHRQVDLARYPEVQRCLSTGEIVLIEDVRKDPEMEEVLDFITLVELRSALVFPLFVREVAIGTLSLTSRREVHGFTRRELLLVRAMANMAAGIVSTSKLLEDVRRSAAAEKPPMEEFDEVVLDIEDQIEGLIEELERK